MFNAVTSAGAGPTPAPASAAPQRIDIRVLLANDASLCGISLHDVDMHGIDLSGKDLSHASLPLDLTGVDLRNTRLEGSSFGRPSMRQTPDLYDADEVWPDHFPDFTHVVMTGARISMYDWVVRLREDCSLPPEPDKASEHRWLSHAFDHLTNYKRGSVLSSIHSIKDDHVKREAMEDTLRALVENYDIGKEWPHFLRDALTDVLFNECYLCESHGAGSTPFIDTIVGAIKAYRFDKGGQLIAVRCLPNVDYELYAQLHRAWVHQRFADAGARVNADM